MKRLIIILTVAIAICAMSVSTLAAWEGFVESPSANGAPTIVEEESEDGVTISAYRERADLLSPSQISNFDSAYKSIVGYASVPDINSKISQIARELKVDPADLAVSDLFYVSIYGGKISASITLESITFENFVCLLRYDGSEQDVANAEIGDDGLEWLVANAEINNDRSEWNVVDVEIGDDGTIKFNALPGAYAVVVSTEETPDYTDDDDVDDDDDDDDDDDEDDNNAIILISVIAIIAVVGATAATIFSIAHKKKKVVTPPPAEAAPPVITPPPAEAVPPVVKSNPDEAAPPTVKSNRRKKKKHVGNKSRNKNRQRKKKRDKIRNRKKKKHG